MEEAGRQLLLLLKKRKKGNTCGTETRRMGKKGGSRWEGIKAVANIATVAVTWEIFKFKAIFQGRD